MSKNQLTEETRAYLQKLVDESCIINIRIPGIDVMSPGIDDVYKRWLAAMTEEQGSGLIDTLKESYLLGEYNGQYPFIRTAAADFGIIPRTSWNAAYRKSKIENVGTILAECSPKVLKRAGLSDVSVDLERFDSLVPPDDWPTRDHREVVEVPENYRF